MDWSRINALARADSHAHEYWTHVSEQHELPLAGSAEVEGHLGRVESMLATVGPSATSSEFRSAIAASLLRDPELLDEARLLVSVKDKRAYLDLSYLFSRIPDPLEASSALCGCRPDELRAHQLSVFKSILRQTRAPARAALAAETIASYLVDEKGLGTMLAIYTGLTADQKAALVTHLVVPGEMQQREAKRRGHGAEAALAMLLGQIGVAVVPIDKATNPMGSHDPNVDLRTFTISPRSADVTTSFDLLVTDATGRVRVCVQSLVQSSDPGQFGVEKAKDTGIVRAGVDAYNDIAGDESPIRFWGLIDGVGYAENKRGTLNPMLERVHCFIQLKSLYKAALDLHTLNLCRISHIRFDAAFYSAEAFDDLAKYVPRDISRDMAVTAPPDAIRAGMAWVVMAGT